MDRQQAQGMTNGQVSEEMTSGATHLGGALSHAGLDTGENDDSGEARAIGPREKVAGELALAAWDNERALLEEAAARTWEAECLEREREPAGAVSEGVVADAGKQRAVLEDADASRAGCAEQEINR